MTWGWCNVCGGEMVSCECEEDLGNDNYDPELDDYEVIDDRQVVWTVNDNGVGRVEVLPFIPRSQ